MFAASKTSAVATGSPPPATDPQFNYVTMLLHGDGTNGAQNNTFVDSSTNNFTITRNGTPTQGSFSPYGDLWSNYFNGSSYLTTASNAAFAMGTSDFTLECWYNPQPKTALYPLIAGNHTTAWAANAWELCDRHASASTKFLFQAYNYSSSTPLLISTTTVVIGVWYHIAVTRSGNVWSLFINGVLEATTTASFSADGGSSHPFQIGRGDAASSALIGSVSNLRLVKGTAVYTSNFTPSTTPLTAVSGTSLLTCQSNRFRDNSINNFTITVTGTPSVQRFSPFDPAAEYSTSVIGGSGFMTGTQYLLLGGQSAFSFNADFTVELWFYALGAGTGTPKLYESRGSGQEGVYVTIEHSGTSLVFRMSSAARITTTFAYNTWNHVALVRSSGVITMYLNGVSAGTYSTSATTLIGTSRPCIGAYPGFDNLNGYVSNLRVVKGTAVYTANFTPPTAPLTAITNTSLLLNTVNAGIFDNAMMNDLVTVGNAQISTSVKKYGTGSMAFDGTGDWLTFIDSPNVQLGSGDFTIEGWIYLSALGSARGFFSKGTSTTGISFGVNSLNQLVFSYTATALTATTPLLISTWYYVAVVRSGSATGNLKIYLNGSVDATSGGAVTDNFNQTSIGYVGADRAATSPMNGYIDDLRITKGVARYTANFTPPTAAFPNN